MEDKQTWRNNPDLNENEINKLKKDGLEVFQDLEELCKQPFNTVPKAYYMYLKYAGLTVQKPQEAGLFMLRVKIPAGILTARQADYLSWLGETYGKGILDLTTRQSVQCHWVPFQALPLIFAKLREENLTTSEAEGDTPRNIVGNPMMNLDPDELFEVGSLIREINDYLQDNRDYSNLPRKFKISISSDIWNSGNAQIQDLAFTPASIIADGQRIMGFHVYAGGGLGAVPALAKQLDIFVEPNQVPDVVKGVLTLYRDYGYRAGRKKARLKFLINDWGIDYFEKKLLEQTGPLRKAGQSEIRGWQFGIVPGLKEQRQKGLYTVGIRILAGRLPAADLKAFGQLAREYGRGELRIDNSQNLLIPFIPEKIIPVLKRHPLIEKYGLLQNGFADYGMCCTGNEFCNMAIANTKDLARELFVYLDETISLDVPVRIAVNGCPNNCGHRSIADIALLGTRLTNKEKGKAPEEGYLIFVGGSLENEGEYACALKGKVHKSEIKKFMEDLLFFVKTAKREGESFYQFYRRVGLAAFQQELDKFL